ncbi:MAG: hypothetical protein IJN57_01165 [Oscillospiraceae bacterium]|nr:hypothetical protein [Oscillospiraceae bacterium]
MMNRATMLAAVLVIGFTLLVMQLASLMQDGSYADAAMSQRQYTVTCGQVGGTIFDRALRPLTNAGTAIYAVTYPEPDAIAELLPHITEMTPLVEGLRWNRPFACRVDTADFSSPSITIVKVPERYGMEIPAQHVLGYLVDGRGVAGLEADYDRILRGSADTASVTYMMDARGGVLSGEVPVVEEIACTNADVVTSIDSRIQRICEEAGAGIEKGAIVVMDAETGDVLAMASFPSYSPARLGEALADENSPFINRCLYTYSVGSIFKLVTAAAAYEQGLTDFVTECTGKTQVSGQVFRCHDHEGHGEVDMKQAMICSCNVYFIELSRLLDTGKMRQKAQDLGFGTQIALSAGLVSQSGTLPTEKQLRLPAEMANFTFGQGLLTASPLQICQMTCGIANDGEMPVARLILGLRQEGMLPEQGKPPIHAKALPKNAAYYLQNLMIAAVHENEESRAVPKNVYAAAKTSTAQTGRYDEKGVEYCHAWITGYIPIEAPQYAITVLVEDGGYGNDAAAPIFREIADRIALECME